MALPATGDKRRVYSRHDDSCPSATFIYKMLVKLLTVGAVEEKLREKLTFLDLTGARSPGAAPLSADHSTACWLVGVSVTCASCSGPLLWVSGQLPGSTLFGSKGPLAKSHPQDGCSQGPVPAPAQTQCRRVFEKTSRGQSGTQACPPTAQ